MNKKVKIIIILFFILLLIGLSIYFVITIKSTPKITPLPVITPLPEITPFATFDKKDIVLNRNYNLGKITISKDITKIKIYIQANITAPDNILNDRNTIGSYIALMTDDQLSTNSMPFWDKGFQINKNNSLQDITIETNIRNNQQSYNLVLGLGVFGDNKLNISSVIIKLY